MQCVSQLSAALPKGESRCLDHDFIIFVLILVQPIIPDLIILVQPHPGHIVASSDKMRFDDYFFSVASNNRII